MSQLFANIRSGLKTGEPKWVIPALIFFGAAILIFLNAFINAPERDGVVVDGQVTNCMYGVERLTGAQHVTCSVKLDDGTVQQRYGAEYLPSGTHVAYQRFQRRLFGAVYEQR